MKGNESEKMNSSVKTYSSIHSRLWGNANTLFVGRILVLDIDRNSLAANVIRCTRDDAGGLLYIVNASRAAEVSSETLGFEGLMNHVGEGRHPCTGANSELSDRYLVLERFESVYSSSKHLIRFRQRLKLCTTRVFIVHLRSLIFLIVNPFGMEHNENLLLESTCSLLVLTLTWPCRQHARIRCI
jgi:hypothetical protein